MMSTTPASALTRVNLAPLARWGRSLYFGGMSATERLILEIETYCSRTGIAPSTFGKYAADDGKLVPRLKNGGSVTLETAERLRAYMRQHAKRA